MANNGARVPVPRITDLSREELESWRAVSNHPLLDGQLIEDITLSTTTKYTRVPHALGRPYRGFLDVRGVGLTEDQSNPNKDKEIWLYRESAPVLIDYVETTTAVSSVTFSGLSGDTDKVYQLVSFIENTTSTSSAYFLQPNGVTTNQDSQELLATNATVAATDEDQMTFFEGNNSAFSLAYFYAETGQERFLLSSNSGVAAGPNTPLYLYAGGWTDETTEVTSIELASSLAGAIGAGSKFWLYALHSRATKASIWIF